MDNWLNVRLKATLPGRGLGIVGGKHLAAALYARLFCSDFSKEAART